VTSVGATELQNGQTGPINTPICTTGGLTCATDGYEIVASNKVLAFFSSGGGFSNVAARPAWQDAVVSAYIKNSTAVPAGNFNASGRGAPDVAAIGHNYYIELGGQTSSVDGTSAATPVFAGLVANLNAWRITNGKPVLGFINPLLYKIHAGFKGAFNDVVQGDNTCTEVGAASVRLCMNTRSPGTRCGGVLGLHDTGGSRRAKAPLVCHFTVRVCRYRHLAPISHLLAMFPTCRMPAPAPPTLASMREWRWRRIQKLQPPLDVCTSLAVVSHRYLAAFTAFSSPVTRRSLNTCRAPGWDATTGLGTPNYGIIKAAIEKLGI
jgi:hypothetical protein